MLFASPTAGGRGKEVSEALRRQRDCVAGRLDGAALTDCGGSGLTEKLGALGSGEQLSLTDLEEGTHVITLWATDGSGQTGAATVTIYMGVAPSQLYLPWVAKAGR